MAAAREALEGARLLTLTGPGGTGKTRLSLQVAAEAAEQFADGVFFVPLDSIVDPALVGSAILNALGTQESPSRTTAEQLITYLRDRRTLLVLDNFEQVLAAAPLVAEILRGAPGTSIIVSSRAALRISGEQEFPVPPLGVPDPAHLGTDIEAMTNFEAVALFIERAVSVRPDFRVTNQNAPAVAEICARLDGLPLAIELAAARIRLLAPEAILSRLGSRLGLLGGGARDLPARQQTLRGAISWSYDLLDEPSRRLLSRFSIFSGGAQLEEAEAVCGPADDLDTDVFDGLATLVDQSLIRQVEHDGEPRFTMLQTIRDFAIEQLEASGDRERIARRHAEVHLAIAEQGAANLMGGDQRRWLDRLEVEHDNQRAALTWATAAAEAELAVRLASALWRFWQMRGYLREGADRLAAVLRMPGVAAPSALRRQALDAAAGIWYWMGDLDGAEQLYIESLAIARSLGEPAAVGEALYNLSFIYSVDKRDMDRARTLVSEALEIYRSLGDRPWIARSLWSLANVYYYRDDFARAEPPLLEAAATFRELGDQFGLGWDLHTLGLIHYATGRLEEARRDWTEMLRIFAAAEDVSGISIALSNFRSLAVADGDLVRGFRLGGASAALVTRSGSDLANVIADSRAVHRARPTNSTARRPNARGPKARR